MVIFLNDIVLPGDKLFDKEERLNYTFVEDNKTYSSIIGLFDGKKVIPLNGPYIPFEGDMVIGIVIDKKFAGYNVNIGLSSYAFMSSKELYSSFEIGDTVFAKISFVDEVGNCELTTPKLLENGIILNFPPTKIPRLIGKKNSMILTIKNKTKTDIVIGKNGFVWLDPKKGNVQEAKRAIEIVSLNSHTSGLTDRIANL